MTLTDNVLGAIARGAYVVVSTQDAVLVLPAWESLPERERAGWVAAASAVRQVVAPYLSMPQVRECLGVDMDCGRELPCPDHPTLL